jgi:SAM-dependent methyltransferase
MSVQSSDPVEEQYVNHPYPEPGDDLPTWLLTYNYDAYDPRLYGSLFWPEGRPRDDLNILVAGCGTMEAAVLAFQNPESRVTGIDFSQASIAHEEQLRERHHLSNLSLKAMDLLEVPTLHQSFDLIVCSGVLHHIPDPAAGLRALASVLEPSHGAMILMLYGRFARAGIYALQDAFRRMRIPRTADGVALVRSIIRRLPPHHAGRKYFEISPEMDSDAAIVDTFLHARDIAFSVPELLDFVEGNGLRFQGWLDSAAYHEKWEWLDASISERDRWAIAENLAAAITTHHFLVCRPERDKRSAVHFNGDEWLSYFPVPHPTSRPSSLGDRKYVRRSHGYDVYEFELSASEAPLFKEANGRRTISDILKHKSLLDIGKNERTALALKFYQRMHRLGHMFFSKTRAPNVPRLVRCDPFGNPMASAGSS